MHTHTHTQLLFLHCKLASNIRNVSRISTSDLRATAVQYGAVLTGSGLGNLEANLASAARIANQVADLRAENDGYGRSDGRERFGGNGLYAGNGACRVGSGLYVSGRGLHASGDVRGKEICDMKGSGNKVPARHMKSQAEDANFFFVNE